MTNRTRCPWCGKKINYHSDSRRVKQKVTPKFLYFAKCVHCNQYYGQAIYNSKFIRMMFYFAFPVLIATFILQIAWPLILYLIIFVPCVLLMPFVQMDETEHQIEIKEGTKYKFSFTGKCKIKQSELYFVSKDFDKNPAFSICSPMYIISFNSKSNVGTFRFLYEHPENEKLLNKNVFEVYDSNMNLIGNINLL